MEAFAVRWYAMQVIATFLRECPDDPAVVEFRAAMDAMRTVTCG